MNEAVRARLDELVAQHRWLVNAIVKCRDSDDQGGLMAAVKLLRQHVADLDAFCHEIQIETKDSDGV